MGYTFVYFAKFPSPSRSFDDSGLEGSRNVKHSCDAPEEQK